jgi:carbamoyltransferase
VGIHVAQSLKKAHSHIKNLCITGGVAQNIIMNQRIYEHAGFDNVFVGPSSYDGGLSLGAALLAARDAGSMKERFVMEHGSWGKGYSTQEIRNEVDNCGLIHTKPQDVVKTAAALLAQGNVLGWFQGRAEFGPRALGNRSILADPRKAEMKETVNRKIKFREEFRPFAPSVLEEKFTEYFEGCPVNPFMTFSARVKSSASPIPGVTHVDDSARPQAVRKATQPQYWSVIKAFEELTSVPVVLNTSFNVKGEPIVNSPTDAIRCFFSTGIDYLVLENVIVSKKNDLSKLNDIEKQSRQESLVSR